MGTPTDALLFYGYCWNEETDQPWTIGCEKLEEEDEDEDWADRYARLKGRGAPLCLVGTHCHHECPMPYVAIKSSLKVSHRGDMTEIKSLAVKPAWNDQLAAFCKVLGIRTDGLRAAWWLVSDCP